MIFVFPLKPWWAIRACLLPAGHAPSYRQLEKANVQKEGGLFFLHHRSGPAVQSPAPNTVVSLLLTPVGRNLRPSYQFLSSFVHKNNPASGGIAKKVFCLLLNRGSLCNYLAFVVEFTFTYMGTVTNMRSAGDLVRRKCSCFSFIVRSALGASLLRMSAFGIWHN